MDFIFSEGLWCILIFVFRAVQIWNPFLKQGGGFFASRHDEPFIFVSKSKWNIAGRQKAAGLNTEMKERAEEERSPGRQFEQEKKTLAEEEKKKRETRPEQVAEEENELEDLNLEMKKREGSCLFCFVFFVFFPQDGSGMEWNLMKWQIEWNEDNDEIGEEEEEDWEPGEEMTGKGRSRVYKQLDEGSEGSESGGCKKKKSGFMFLM